MELVCYVQVKWLVLLLFVLWELVVFELEICVVVKEIVDEFVSQGLCEFVFDVVFCLFVYMFCKLFGVLNVFCEIVFIFGNEVVDLENYKFEDELLLMMKLFVIVVQLIEQKKQQLDDFMFSWIIYGEVDGEKFDEMNINMFFVMFLIVGYEMI